MYIQTNSYKDRVKNCKILHMSNSVKRESLKVKRLTHLIKWKKFTALRCLPDFVLKTS